MTGSRAVIGIEDTLEFPPAISGALIEVTDGTSDSFGFVLLGQVPTVCPSSVTPLEPVVSGDIVVTDAQPFPTSKDQCKHGGWRNYPSAFENQGQCVAFVQRGRQP